MNIPRLLGILWVVGQAGILFLWGTTIYVTPDVSQRWFNFFPLFIPSILLIVCGIALTLTGTKQLGSAFTPSPEPKPGGAFVATGIYGRVRHPLYGGILLVVWGISLPLLSLPPLVGAIGVSLFFYLKSIYEERRLRLRFSGYDTYARRTPRFLPRIFSPSR